MAPVFTVLPSEAMTDRLYRVESLWDPEAEVWVATSAEIPGLATEAASLELLTEKLKVMIPELLAANGLLGDAVTLAGRGAGTGACPYGSTL